MIAFKGFNKKMECTMGKGTFKYEVGKTYEEENAKTAKSGFHCTEEPLEVLNWYPDGRFCMVQADGDINESGDGKIACTKMQIMKELTKAELVAWQIRWLIDHPERIPCKYVQSERGTAQHGVVIVRGKNPAARGGAGDILALMKEDSGKTTRIGIFAVGEDGINPNKFYNVKGEQVEI